MGYCQSETSSGSYLPKLDRYFIAVCIALGILATVACSCSGVVPFQTDAFDIGEVEIVTSKELENLTPVSVTQVFTADDRQICVSVKARLKENIDVQEAFGTDIGPPALTFTEYYRGQKMNEFLTQAHYSPDGWVIGGYCSEAVQGSFPKGRYEVRVKLLSAEIGTAKYEVK